MNLPYFLRGPKWLATVCIDGELHQFTFRFTDGHVPVERKKAHAKAVEVANWRYNHDTLPHRIVLVDVEYVGV